MILIRDVLFGVINKKRVDKNTNIKFDILLKEYDKEEACCDRYYAK